MGLMLLLVISVVALVTGIVLTVQAQNLQLSTASDQQLTTVTAVSQTNNDTTTPFTGVNFTNPFFGMGIRGGMRGRGPCGFGRGAIEVSSDYVANVTDIAKADTDVQQLLNSGYDITRVIPQTRMTIDGNGNVAMMAINATLLLENGTKSRAFVTVDLQQGKVTQIVMFTRTVINKP